MRIRSRDPRRGRGPVDHGGCEEEDALQVDNACARTVGTELLFASGRPRLHGEDLDLVEYEDVTEGSES